MGVHNGTSADHGIVTYRHAGQYHSACANQCARTNLRRTAQYGTRRNMRKSTHTHIVVDHRRVVDDDASAKLGTRRNNTLGGKKTPCRDPRMGRHTGPGMNHSDQPLHPERQGFFLARQILSNRYMQSAYSLWGVEQA